MSRVWVRREWVHSFTHSFIQFFFLRSLLPSSLSVLLSFVPSIDPSIYLPIHPYTIHPSICLLIHSLTDLHANSYIHLATQPSIHSLTHLFIHLSIFHPPTHLSIYPSITFTHPSIYLFIHPSIYLIGTKSLLCTRYSAECCRFRYDEQGPSPCGGQNQLMRETDNRPLNKEMS